MALAAAIALAAEGCRHPSEEKGVTVVTTPDLAGTGLPQQLITDFSAQSRVKIDLLVVDETQVAGLASREGADVAIVNSPAADALRQAHEINLQATFAYDDFVIAGPKRDPARAREAKSARDAFRRIFDANAPFCAPSQVPALRGREADIWAAAGVDPHGSRSYVQCKGDAKAVLIETARRGAYTLTDHSTLDGSRARVSRLLDGAPLLENDQTAVLFDGPQKNSNAAWFVQWLMSYRARELVEAYRVADGRRFYTSR